MRFSTVILSTLLAAFSVSAENATTTSAVVSGTAPLTPAQSTEAACLAACPSGDDTCRTKCVPLGSSANGIADCITNCPKGKGTASDNAAYESCVRSCVSAAGVSATAAPTATGSSPTGTGVAPSGGASTGASGVVAPSGTGAGTKPSSTATGTGGVSTSSSAADNMRMGVTFVSTVGFFAALFAM